jgi:hypothetical protein
MKVQFLLTAFFLLIGCRMQAQIWITKADALNAVRQFTGDTQLTGEIGELKYDEHNLCDDPFYNYQSDWLCV